MRNDVLPSLHNFQKRKCIDLFAGAGGLSTGLELAGFEVLFANEIMPAYANSLSHNHPDTEVYVDDIRSLSVKKIRKQLGLAKGELDLVAGGPPCQGFSINAPIRTAEDKRNHLFLNYLEFVDEFRPKVVLIENVPGMVSFESGATVLAILKSLENLGYQADVRILYAPHYGVPQMRWRTIFLATRLDVSAQSLYPVPTHQIKGRANFTTKLKDKSLILSDEYVNSHAFLPFTSVQDALGDLPGIGNGAGMELMEYETEAQNEYQRYLRVDSEKLTNHHCARLGAVNIARLPYIPPGGSWRDIPFELLPKGMQRARRSDHTKRYGRLDPTGIASTILTKCDPHWGAYIHPSQHRVLSVREAARIQSFPDRTQFFGSITEQYEQVGNAVPPLFARAIGEQVSKILDTVDGPQLQSASDEGTAVERQAA